jgi:hypothetical protein
MVASGAALTAVFLAPWFLWLFLTALPISGRVQATAESERQVELRFGPAGWIPVPVGRVFSAAGAGISPEIFLSCPDVLLPGQACAEMIRLAAAPSGAIVPPLPTHRR